MKEKLLEIIQAGAIGDAFGYQVEFDKIDTIKQKYGIFGIKYEESNLEKDASDDTQMTLFLWDAIIKYIKNNEVYDEKSFTKEVHKSFMEWFSTQTHHPVYSSEFAISNSSILSNEELFKRQAPGATCLSALSTNTARSTVKKINDSKGCGSVMRVAPLLLLKEHYKLTNEALFVASMNQAAITHGNDEGMAATSFFTIILEELKNQKSVDEAYHIALNLTYKLKPNKFSSYIESVYKKAQEPNLLKENDLTDQIGEGWIADEAVGVALYCAVKAQSFAHCLELSSNHSGDSDSTASMAAQLYVAKNGLDEKDILFKTDLDNVIISLKNKTDNINIKTVFKRI